jgi:mannose-6-phosphate isomerase
MRLWAMVSNAICRAKSPRFQKCAAAKSLMAPGRLQENAMSRAVQIVYPRDMGPREWGEEILIAQGDGYIGKKLLMKAGKAGGLQYHREKEETFMLLEGEAYVDTDNDGDGLKRIHIVPGVVIHVPKGAVHRVTAVTDCTFLEWSNDVFNDRVRCEAEYGQEEGGGLPSTS